MAFLTLPLILAGALAASGVANRTLHEWVPLLVSADEQEADEAWERLYSDEAVPELIGMLRTTRDRKLFRKVCERLSGHRKQVASQIEALLPGRPEQRTYLAAALAALAPERARGYVAQLAQCTKSADVADRSLCVRGLAELGGPEAATALLALLDDPDFSVRKSAVRGLRHGPAEQVRAALEARLEDPAHPIRYEAASSLVPLVADPPAAAVRLLVDALCLPGAFPGDFYANMSADVLESAKSAAAKLAAEELLVARLGRGDPACRMRSALVLGRLQPSRAVPALDLVRQALRSEVSYLRFAAVQALYGMSCQARAALPELEQAARAGDQLAAAAQRRVEHHEPWQACPFDHSRLVAIAARNKGALAYVVSGDGKLRELAAGAPFLDGVIERVDALGLTFKGRQVRDDFTYAPWSKSLRLFEGKPPDAQPFDLKTYTGERLSVDLDGDVSTLASLAGHVGGLDLIVEGGASGPVRVSARDAPWDGVLARGLEAGGFGYRIDHNVVRIARAERLASVRLLSERSSVGEPVSFSVHRAELADLERLFEDIAQREFELPPPPYETVTLFVKDMPWDRVTELIAASRGWKQRLTDKRVFLEPAP